MTNASIAIKGFNEITHREHMIADFSSKKLLQRKIQELEKAKKNIEKEKIRLEMSVKNPITKEQFAKENETKQDEAEMEQMIPIRKRTIRKEEAAVGKLNSNMSFIQALEEVGGEQSEDVLMKTNTVFPFDFFPDTLVIDPVKVQIFIRYFFFSQQIRTVYIKDILEASVEEGPFFATLQILSNNNKNSTTRISALLKHDAEKAARIIQGLVLARSESPDIAKVEAIR